MFRKLVSLTKTSSPERNSYLPLETRKTEGDADVEVTPETSPSGFVLGTGLAREPSAKELRYLRRVPGRVPWVALVIALVELAERSSYYGCTGVFPNFIQRPLPPGSTTGAPVWKSDGDIGVQTLLPGALGQGLRTTSAIITIFGFMAYLCPIGGGLIADLKLNKFRTIALGTLLGILGHAVLVFAAAPSVLTAGGGMAPFLFSLLLLSLSTGLIKSNIAPLMCDQIVGPDLMISVAETGEAVIIDKSLTIQRAMNLFYACINIGSFFSAVTTFAEKYIGFWLAYAIPGVIFLATPLLMYLVRPRLVVSDPAGSVLLDVFRIIRIVFNGDDKAGASNQQMLVVDRWEKAKAEAVVANGRSPAWYTWDDVFVEDLRRACHGCKIFLFFPVYHLCLNGLAVLVTSLTGSMTAHNIPNDFFPTLNSLTIVLIIPLFTYYLYPTLLKRRIPFGPIRRVVTGFMLAAAGYGYAAALQLQVYRTSPCGYYATDCQVGTGVSPINVWWTSPIPVLAGVSEVLAMITGLEIAYNQAPKELKSVVSALFLSAVAVSKMIVLIVTPTFKDPYLVLPFLIVSLATVASAFAIHLLFEDEPMGARKSSMSADEYELAGSENGH